MVLDVAVVLVVVVVGPPLGIPRLGVGRRMVGPKNQPANQLINPAMAKNKFSRSQLCLSIDQLILDGVLARAHIVCRPSTCLNLPHCYAINHLYLLSFAAAAAVVVVVVVVVDVDVNVDVVVAVDISQVPRPIEQRSDPICPRSCTPANVRNLCFELWNLT